MSVLVTIRLKGGLGNQLFIYFAGACFAKRLSGRLIIDTSDLGSARQPREFEIGRFELPVSYSCVENVRNRKIRLLRRLLRSARDLAIRFKGDLLLKPKTIGYFDLNLSVRSIVLDGYFQSFRYFQELEQSFGVFDILKYSDENEFNFIESIAKNSITVHVRRGDFLDLKDSVGVLDFSYYLFAINEARKLYPNSPVLLFGDDLEFLKLLNLSTTNSSIPELERRFELRNLLQIFSSSQCIVSSNSTFSWWGCFLARQSTVIFPETWHKKAESPDVYFSDSIIKIPSVWEK